MASKRNYKANLAFVETAFSECWRNVQDLVKGARLLRDNDLHAQCLSLSVLAVEELGKLFCIDGLLYARTDDEKAEAFAKSLRNHATKLEAFVLFPALMGNIARVDPRYGKDKRFAEALVICIRDLQSKGNAVLDICIHHSFQYLDRLKQQGFYSRPTEKDFVSPAGSIERKVADAVYELAWRATDVLNFLFKGDNLERYVEAARAIRAKAMEVDHRRAEVIGKLIHDALFTEEDRTMPKTIQ